MSPPDDASIDNATCLFRRVPPQQVTRDRNRGTLRPMSGHFLDTEMSVVLGDQLEAAGRSPESAVGRHTDDFLVCGTAQCVRDEEQGVVHTEKDDEAAHGDVVGNKPKPRARRFANGARWVIEPPTDFEPFGG